MSDASYGLSTKTLTKGEVHRKTRAIEEEIIKILTLGYMTHFSDDLQETRLKDAQEDTTSKELAVCVAEPGETGDNGPADSQSGHCAKPSVRSVVLGVFTDV